MSGWRAFDRADERLTMVETQLRARGIVDARVLDAFRTVPRHLFVPENMHAHAYDDSALPIGHGQTISQPYVVAFMTEILMLGPTDRVLEIGTGCGYQTAILAELVHEIYTVEIVEALATEARERIGQLGYANVQFRQGDGGAGWPEAAPFTKVLVAAAPEQVPEKLVDQLAVGGMMVIPVGSSFDTQELTLITKAPAGIVSREVMSVRFVPMVSSSIADSPASRSRDRRASGRHRSRV